MNERNVSHERRSVYTGTPRPAHVPELHGHWARVIWRASSVLTPTEKLLLQVMQELDDTRYGKPGGCFAGEAKLAEELGVTSPDSVGRLRRKLEGYGLLLRERVGRKSRWFPLMPVPHVPPNKAACATWIRARVAELDAILTDRKSGETRQDVGGDPTNGRAIPDNSAPGHPTICRGGGSVGGARARDSLGDTPPTRHSSESLESFTLPPHGSNSPDRSPVGPLPSVADASRNGADAPSESQSPALRAGYPGGKQRSIPPQGVLTSHLNPAYRRQPSREGATIRNTQEWAALGMQPVRNDAGTPMGHISTGRVDLDAARAAYVPPGDSDPF